MRNSLTLIGGHLFVSSFVWLAEDGMELSPTRHEHIYRQLNTTLWPLRYADIRRLADFQNRVFRRYAARRGVGFIDVAADMPQDPNLFVDAIHMSEIGERLKAWIVFQQLVPTIRSQIESGELPKVHDGRSLPPPPSLAAREASTRCQPTANMKRVAGAVSLSAITLAYEQASIERGPPVKVITAAQPGAYAASLAVHIPAGVSGAGFLIVRARVLKGQVGMGVLDSRTGEFQAEMSVRPSAAVSEVYVPILSPERTRTLIIRNGPEGGVKSEVLIEDITLVAPPAPE
jgi:hypothetical protein